MRLSTCRAPAPAPRCSIPPAAAARCRTRLGGSPHSHTHAYIHTYIHTWRESRVREPHPDTGQCCPRVSVLIRSPAAHLSPTSYPRIFPRIFLAPDLSNSLVSDRPQLGSRRSRFSEEAVLLSSVSRVAQLFTAQLLPSFHPGLPILLRQHRPEDDWPTAHVVAAPKDGTSVLDAPPTVPSLRPFTSKPPGQSRPMSRGPPLRDFGELSPLLFLQDSNLHVTLVLLQGTCLVSKCWLPPIPLDELACFSLPLPGHVLPSLAFSHSRHYISPLSSTPGLDPTNRPPPLRPLPLPYFRSHPARLIHCLYFEVLHKDFRAPAAQDLPFR